MQGGGGGSQERSIRFHNQLLQGGCFGLIQAEKDKPSSGHLAGMQILREPPSALLTQKLQAGLGPGSPGECGSGLHVGATASDRDLPEGRALVFLQLRAQSAL